MKTSCLRLKLVELNFFASFNADDQRKTYVSNVSKYTFKSSRWTFSIIMVHVFKIPLLFSFGCIRYTVDMSCLQLSHFLNLVDCNSLGVCHSPRNVKAWHLGHSILRSTRNPAAQIVRVNISQFQIFNQLAS